MSKFAIRKLPTKEENIKAVMYRMPDYQAQEAFKKALAESGLSGQQLVDAMVKHCLKDAGYLPSEKEPTR